MLRYAERRYVGSFGADARTERVWPPSAHRDAISAQALAVSRSALFSTPARFLCARS